MKFIKRLLIGVVVLLILLVVALFAAPILFKDQIVANVKTSVNKMVDAEVDFSDIDVSFLRSFPDVSVEVYDVQVVGIDTFEGQPLFAAKEVDVDLGFWSVVGGDGSYNIDGVALTDPAINLLVVTPELANYLIVPESTDAPSPDPAPAAAQFNLDHYEISNGSFIYDDRTTGTYLEIKGLNTSGDGDFTSTLFDLDTYSEMDELTLSQGGITYLNKVKATADAIINVNLDEQLYTFRENAVKLNALDLAFDGTIQLAANDDILFNLTYSAPANDFRQLWSMIPATFVEGFEQVKTTGSFTLNGSVNGAFNSVAEKYPAFTVKANIENGSVQYPGRPVGIDGIAAAISVNSPSSDLDKLKVDIPRLQFNLGGDPFSGSLRLATLLSDPDVDAKMKGKIDLDKWAKAIPLEGVRELGGQIIADIVLENVRQSVLDRGDYAGVNMAGDLSLANIIYIADDLPAVKIGEAKAAFTPQAINLESFSANLGRSDLKGSGKITTPLAYFSPEQTMRGDLTFQSDFFDADEWITEESSTTVSPAELEAAGSEGEETAEVFDRFDFNIDASIDALQYGTYRPTGLKAVGNVKPNKLEISSAAAQLGESKFTASGVVNNLFDYTFEDGVLGGALDVKTPYLNMADFMEEETTASTSSAAEEAPASTAAIPVPDNINLKVNMAADRIKYDDIDLTNALGSLVIQGGQAVIEDGTTDIFGGRMKFAGAYDTSEPGDPGFRFHYDMSQISFNQAFDKLNTFKALTPVGKFLTGTFNTDMVLEGKLGEDLFPKLNTLDAKGLLQTLNAELANIEPLQKIGQALNVNELKNSTVIKNLITVFKIEDGNVEVEPFDLKLAGIPMTVAGRHGLDSDMDYTIRAAIPRAMIEGNQLAGAALSALDQLGGQAAKLGLNISPGDTLNVNIGLTGSFSNPKTKFKLLGTNGTGDVSVQDAIRDAVKDRVTEEIDTRKEEAKEEVNKQVNQVKEDAQARIDSLKRVADDRSKALQDSIKNAAAARAEALRKEAERKLKMQIDSARLDSLKNILPDGVKDQADKLKEELGKFNPFKKKKKKDGGK